MVADRILIGTSDFVSSTTADYRLAYATEMCGCLSPLQSMDNFFVNNNDSAKIKLALASYFLGVIHKLEKETKLVSMNTKLRPIVRELLSIKLKT